MSADHLGQALHHDVGAQLQRFDQDRRRKGIVHHEGAISLPGDAGQGFHIDETHQRIGHRFHK